MIELTGIELKPTDFELKVFLGDASISKSGTSRVEIRPIYLTTSSNHRWFNINGPSCKQKDLLVWVHKLAETFDEIEDIMLTKDKVLKASFYRAGEKYDYAFELRLVDDMTRFLYSSFQNFSKIRIEMLKAKKADTIQTFIENCRRIVK